MVRTSHGSITKLAMVIPATMNVGKTKARGIAPFLKENVGMRLMSRDATTKSVKI